MQPALDQKTKTKSAKSKAADVKSVENALKTVLATLEDAKAENIIPIDLQGRSALADHMVIASGRSHRHVAAVADYVMTALKAITDKPLRVEGLSGADWVLIDQGDIIVHIFRPEVRDFYSLEKIWLVTDDEDDTVH